MKFDEFDRQMRKFESKFDEKWPDEGFIVVRLDGRSFTKLTKEQLDFERPFDIRFHKAMRRTCEHLMDVGIQMVFGYTQSDEVSLLLHPQEGPFSRKTRKLNSILAGEASGVFSLAVQTATAFDCRICPLPNKQAVIDYFRWRAEDAKRNSLSAFCYWTLREKGNAPNEASKKTKTMRRDDKIELLSSLGVSYDEQSDWKKLGSIIHWKNELVKGINPMNGEESIAERRRIDWLSGMPEGMALTKFVQQQISAF